MTGSRILVFGLFAVALAASETRAQLMLPGAAPAEPQGAKVAPARHKSSGSSVKEAGAGAKGVKAGLEPGIASLAGRPLMLNGKSGLLQISGDDKTATIDKLELAGESVSEPSQRCVVDIVGEKPILATSAGRPDGLMRFEADVPACPIAFDVLDGAVLVPAQITACVFKAADCQTTPGGLWGPDGASLVGDAAKIVKERAAAEKAMAKIVRAIEDRAKESPRRPTWRATRTASPASATNSATTTPRKASTAIAPCASPRRGPLFSRRGSMRSRPQRRPRRRAKRARRGSRRRGPSSPSADAARVGPASAREADCLRGACVARGLDPWSVARRPEVIR